MYSLALSCSSRPRAPVRGRRLHHARKTLDKQWLTYQSALTVFLSSSGMVATWQNFAYKHAIICLEALLFLLNFTGGFSSGKTHTAYCCIVSGSCYIPRFRLRPCYDVPNARRSSSVKFSQHVGAPVYTTPLLLFTRVMGHPTGTNFLTSRQS